LVDTGAGLTYINGQSARQLHLERLGWSGKVGGANGCPETVHAVGIDDWSMGRMTLPLTYALAGPVVLTKGSIIHGVLGPDVLAAYRRVTFDFTHERLVIQGPPRYSAKIRDTKPGSPVTPDVPSGADARLARTTLADQVAALRQGGGWSAGGIAGEGLMNCAATASGARDLTGRANSSTLSYDHGMQLRLEDYLYSDAAAAKRAFRSLRSKTAETCIEKFIVARTRTNYPVGSVDVIAPKSVRAGDQARAAAIIVPVTYRGRVVRNYDDYVLARKGRDIVAVSTAASGTVLSYDVKLTRWIAQLASTEQAGRPKGTRAGQTTWTRYPLRVLNNLPQRCERQAGHKSRLEAPIIYRRGSYTAVLFVDKPDNYTFFCSWEPNPYLPPSDQDQFETTDEEPAVPSRHSFEGIESAPLAIGIQDGQGGDQTCDTPPNPNIGEMYGFVGSDVAAATFEFAHEPPIKAVVDRGFYIASWPYASWPDAVALKTTFGTTVIRHVPNRGGC
jgi:hypothetical protein